MALEKRQHITRSTSETSASSLELLARTDITITNNPSRASLRSSRSWQGGKVKLSIFEEAEAALRGLGFEANPMALDYEDYIALKESHSKKAGTK